MPCSGCAHPGERRCIWAMRWRRGCMRRCWRGTSRFASARTSNGWLGMAMPSVVLRSGDPPAAGGLSRERASCWRPGDFRTTPNFASGSFPTQRVLSRQPLLPRAATACVSRWPAAPISARVSRMPPTGCPPRCFGARTAVRACSRTPSPTARNPASSRSMRREGVLSTKPCRTTNSFAPCCRTATTPRAARFISSATAGFSGPMG